MIRIRIKIGFGATIISSTRPASPTSQNAGCSAATARPPSSGTIGKRLKRFRKNPTYAMAVKKSRSVAAPIAQKAQAPSVPDDRACERDPRFAPHVVGELLQRDQRAEKRDEHRRAHRQALALGLEHVAHLVDEEEHDEPDGEPPAPEQRVRRDRDEPRERRADELELEHDDGRRLELPEERADEGERHPQLARDRAPGGLRMHGLVAAQLREVVLLLGCARPRRPVHVVLAFLLAVIAHRLVVAESNARNRDRSTPRRPRTPLSSRAAPSP